MRAVQSISLVNHQCQLSASGLSVNSCWIKGGCFFHPSKRQGLVLLRMSDPLVTARQTLAEGMNGWMDTWVYERSCWSQKCLGYISDQWAHTPQDSEQASPGDSHLVHRSLERLTERLSVLKRKGHLSMSSFKSDWVHFLIKSQGGSLSQLPQCTPRPPSPRNSNYCLIISSASHCPHSQGSLMA